MLSQFWADGDDRTKGGKWIAMTGGMEQATGIFEPKEHEFVADTLDGGFADFLCAVDGRVLPRWASWPGKSEQLPSYWHASARTLTGPSNRLHAHCKCGGVNFWVTRPSERSKEAYSPMADVLVPMHEQAKQTQGEKEHSTWWLRDNDTKFLAGVCYCNSCRLDTGMEWMEWAFVPTIDISLDEQGKIPFSLPFGTLKAFRSSPTVVRYHCSDCGASVFFTSEERDGLVDVAVGILDAPEGAGAESWLDWQTQRLSFREDAVSRAEKLAVAVEDGLRRFGQSSRA